MPNVLISELDASAALATGDMFLVQHAAGPPAEYCTATQVSDYVTKTALATSFIFSSGARVSSAGNFTFGAGSALATTATVGYVMIQSCAGVPTGVPVGFGAGNIPIVFDTTNLRLYAYTPSGAWKMAQFA